MQVSGDPGVPGQVPQVLAHLGRAGRAVQPDAVDAERLQRGQRGADLAAEQHRAGGLHGDLDQDRQRLAGLVQGPPGADDRGLGLQQVLRGLHQHRVGAAGDQAADLLGVGVAQQGVAGVAQGGQLGARADRAEHEPGVLRRGPGVGRLPGDPGTGLGQLGDPVRDAVLAKVAEVGAEGVGLDAVDADREVRLVDAADDVRPGDVEDLVAALVALEVVQRGVCGLQHRAHRAVGDDDAFGQGGPQAIGPGTHPGSLGAVRP